MAALTTMKLIIAYDGTHYCGWQRQLDEPTIQQELEQGVGLICNEPITVHGAGRTDAGVHARGMTAHLQTRCALSTRQLLNGLNSVLPPAIRVLAIEKVADDFHARFSAKAKTYRYSVFCGKVMLPEHRLYHAHYPYTLAKAQMSRCLAQIVGTHDFTSFENSGTRDKSSTSGRGAIRTLGCAKLTERGQHRFDMYFTGDGFLKQMVRNLAGTILEVGRGLRTTQDFTDILMKKDRQAAGVTAPACGLTLMNVCYEGATSDFRWKLR